ncbi:hypothetical protein [Quadrisphaera sp. INWT6]|uniref:hypothetical protein n=1 Tax=Quadrisphaera sp. INWT6 TaxID=2596917 RepID=UPI0018920B9B|nr:hypothetical protein [Quadrisphaera sp. INWT6]MBF5082610.1 hypothetical protein [Quadrisphaera sp. INWT6]
MSVDTPLLRRAVPALRVELADAATRGRTVTLAEASAFLGLPHPRREAPLDGGPSAPEVLEALQRMCAERGEPDLASLVLPHDDVDSADSTDGAGGADELEGSAGSCDEERRRCWRHWGGPAAEATGLARTSAPR